MVDFVLGKHAQISVSICRTIFLTCFVVANILLIVILPTSDKNQFLPAKAIFAGVVFFRGKKPVFPSVGKNLPTLLIPLQTLV